MAANFARRTLQVSSPSAKSLLSRSTITESPFATKAAKLSGGPPNPTSVSRISTKRLISSSCGNVDSERGKWSLNSSVLSEELPAELGGALSLMPLHSVTASALFTSLLSLNNVNWGCLSEGFATPL